ncbi:MAG: sigma factor [Aureliella sp.]
MNRFNSSNPFISKLVRDKARQLARKPGSASDAEDFEQDLLIKLLQAAPQFDPEIAHENAFGATVVERQSASIVRGQRAKKRSGPVVSLSITVSLEGHPTELAELIGHRELDARRARHPRSKEELEQLSSDVHAVIATLPAPLRDLAERLMRMSLSQAARELGLTRTASFVRMAALRRRFEAAGLKNYLRKY